MLQLEVSRGHNTRGQNIVSGKSISVFWSADTTSYFLEKESEHAVYPTGRTSSVRPGDLYVYWWWH
jgi:hypothetical protein